MTNKRTPMPAKPVFEHKDLVLENMHADWESRNDLLDQLPHFNKVSGNPTRYIIESVMQNTMEAVENGLQGVNEEMDSSLVPAALGDIFPALFHAYGSDDPIWNILSVQPMQKNTGTIYYWEDLYGEAAPTAAPRAIASGDRIDLYPSRTYSDQTVEGEDAAEVDIKTSSFTIDTRDKKLKNVTTPQAMQDVQRNLGTDLSPMISALISNTLRREIGRWAIYNLVTYATAANQHWQSSSPLATDIINQLAYQNTLAHAIIDVSGAIADRIHKNPNFIMSSRTNINRLKKGSRTYEINPALAQGDVDLTARYLHGVTEEGMRCYVDPYWEFPNIILVGYKGTSWFDAGAFHAPFVPYWETPVFYDPDAGGKRKVMGMTRFGKVTAGTRANSNIIDGRYFGLVTIQNS